MIKFLKNIFLYIGDLLFEVWDSITDLFTCYKRKKRELEDQIFFILSDINLYNSISERILDDENKDYQEEIYSELKVRVRMMRCLLMRRWGSSRGYGGMVYRWFINKLDMDKLNKETHNEENPITKEDLLDKKLFSRYLEKHIIWRKARCI